MYLYNTFKNSKNKNKKLQYAVHLATIGCYVTILFWISSYFHLIQRIQEGIDLSRSKFVLIFVIAAIPTFHVNNWMMVERKNLNLIGSTIFPESQPTHLHLVFLKTVHLWRLFRSQTGQFPWRWCVRPNYWAKPRKNIKSNLLYLVENEKQRTKKWRKREL